MYKNIKSICKYKRVLLVHRDKKSLVTLIKLFNKLFLSVDIAYDYSSAIDKFNNRKYRYNLIITDLELDSNNGIELLEHTRKEADIPVLFLIKNRNYMTMELSKIENFDIASNPIKIEELLNKISIILKNNSIDEYTADTLIHMYKSVIDALKEIIETGQKRDYVYHTDSIVNFFVYTQKLHQDFIDLEKFKIIITSAKTTEEQKKVFLIFKGLIEKILKSHNIYI